MPSLGQSSCLTLHCMLCLELHTASPGMPMRSHICGWEQDRHNTHCPAMFKLLNSICQMHGFCCLVFLAVLEVDCYSMHMEHLPKLAEAGHTYTKFIFYGSTTCTGTSGMCSQQLSHLLPIRSLHRGSVIRCCLPLPLCCPTKSLCEGGLSLLLCQVLHVYCLMIHLKTLNVAMLCTLDGAGNAQCSLCIKNTASKICFG